MNKKMIMSIIICFVLLTAIMPVSANTDITSGLSGLQEQMQGGRGMQPGNGMGRGGGMQGGVQNIVNEPGTIVTSTAVNTAKGLEADTANAVQITVSEENNDIEINEAGTYVISGSASEGSITVKKGTTGVVLILGDLDLTCSTGAPLSINKGAEVRIIVSGTATLTDAEDPANENSADQTIADAFDGAALKAKADSMVFITGSGTLNLIGQAKNGLKGGDNASLILDGPTIQIAAANDGINVNYDLAILSGAIAVSANDDAIHANHILTIGREDGTGPVVYIAQSNEGLEGTVVNIFGGDITINSSDDAINAADKDELYTNALTPSINMTGGSVTVSGQGDGFDSNGNINLVSGSAAINVEYQMGEAGIDYDGAYYISEDFVLNNTNGVSGPDNMGGGPGGGRGGWGMP